MHFSRTILAAALSLTLAAAASAQFSPVMGSGCPGGSSITTSGTPQLNMTISYQWFCTARGDTPFLLFGPAIPPVFTLPTPIACSANCMLIHPAPPLLVGGPSGRGLTVPVTIPADASLIGQSIHTQGGCVASTSGCIYLGVAVATQIMP